jgi:uncharacterized protein (DUF1499 family)
MRDRLIISGLVLAAALGGCSGSRPPANLGVTGGRLAPCPSSPNCVASQAGAESRRVEPLRYQGDPAPARDRLLAVLNGMERVRIVQTDTDYMHAEFTSAVFGFVDDVEFQFDPPGFIQIRSASRAGYYDFGVNRKRVETIRQRFIADDG